MQHCQFVDDLRIQHGGFKKLCLGSTGTRVDSPNVIVHWFSRLRNPMFKNSKFTSPILIPLLPSGKLTQLLNMAMEIVRFPMKNDDFPHWCNVYQRLTSPWQTQSVPFQPIKRQVGSLFEWWQPANSTCQAFEKLDSSISSKRLRCAWWFQICHLWTQWKRWTTSGWW